MLIILVFIAVFAVLQLSRKQPQLVQQNSNYAIHTNQGFNQPSFYPLNQKISINNYKPVGNWIGRLILPTPEQLQDGLDWVWMEVEHAPTAAEKLLGKTVRLEWQKNQDLLMLVQAVTKDINFTPEVINSQKQGNIHPFRLNGVRQVGVLRSLAGANPNDDTIVALNDNTIIANSEDKSILKIDSEPILITGRFYGLVKIIKPIKPRIKSDAKVLLLAKQKQYHDYFLVKHYNASSQNFDGVEETIRIPQQVRDTRNFAPSTTQQIEKSSAGKDGWYIYGADDVNNMFTVQAIAPYSLFSIKPNERIIGEELGLNYIKKLNWLNTEVNKGNLNTVSISITNQSKWQEGDKAILLHLYGGIGGKKAEPLGVVETITGHFAFGTAEVIRDKFTQKLRFDIQYHQIYAHNPDGIIAGTHTWANYMGNLQRGWLSTRPVSDILIKYEPVTQNYDFDGVKISPLQEFQQQLQIGIARYRSGDGTGGATVSPATSCVQDSNQALYVTILTVKNKIATNPQIQTWLKANPKHPQTLRFQELVKLSQSLERQLTPLGIVRADWQSQASILAGTGTGKSIKPFKDGSIWAGLTTWRTMMPRQAHDDLARIFLKHGAIVHFLRTNQVGGWQTDITPIAPTIFFGKIQIPFTDISPLPIILNRILASLSIPTFSHYLTSAIALAIYSLIAITFGFKSGFLSLQTWSANWVDKTLLSIRCLFLPSIVEELFFRVLLLPHPSETTNWWEWTLWAAFSLILFIVYHPLNAKYFYKAGLLTFFNPVFLILAGLLGTTCTIIYGITGSLWLVVLIHWIVVITWLVFFGGIGKLGMKNS
ncbi:Abortive infection protein [Calothrix sp. PCC 6303]|nr:Abortive infection protein [Calothrix sp. PCC 6303]